MLPGFVAHENFFPEAGALRAEFDNHFARPYQNTPETHDIWNYWYVPSLYTYLRAKPSRLFSKDLMSRFMDHLKRFARETYGFTRVYYPYLSLYVAGCRQGLHNDSQNGRLGYVYSITRWNERNFQGGETLIMSEQPYFNSKRVQQAEWGTMLHALVPALFNQMLVFDDRLPHAVQRIEGTMEPTQGRVVMHGHFVEGPPHVEGHLTPAQVEQTLQLIASDLGAHVQDVGRGLVGAVNLRLVVGANGAVQGVTKLFDRLLPIQANAPDPDKASDGIARFFDAVRFPATPGESRVTLSMALGGRLGG